MVGQQGGRKEVGTEIIARSQKGTANKGKVKGQLGAEQMLQTTFSNSYTA